MVHVDAHRLRLHLQYNGWCALLVVEALDGRQIAAARLPCVVLQPHQLTVMTLKTKRKGQIQGKRGKRE